MITRIARDDVVRITRTGEVGTVKGWADHEQLDQHGTILDVEVARGKTIQANGNALELVANAKLKAHPLASLLVILAAAGVASLMGYELVSRGVGVWLAVSIGLMLYPAYDRVLTAMFLRRKTRVTLPKRKPQARAQAEAEVGYATLRKI